ncbi:hypothetical protein CAC42_1419 [Sphaceloma murrayae]|uniref:Myb-like domain-containing protein n=1 Tax=Sphaceloma murrayae TaxID=2082308 RepID=A0A2K1QFM9_9PEZI|nr:hypothetical protein CAC42_1419 [Sphaceloma murrayae]
MSYHPLDGPGELPVSTGELPGPDSLAAPWGYPAQQLPYSDPYMGPFVTSADDHHGFPAPSTSAGTTPVPHAASAHGSPWSSYSRPLPQPPQEVSHGYTTLPAPLSMVPSHFQNRPISSLDNRPRSSPSTFGPSADSINWPDPRNALGLHYGLGDQAPTLSSNFTPPSYPPVPSVLGNEIFASPSPPEIKQPQPRRQYPTLAPNPAGLPSKRSKDDEDDASDATGKRRKRTCSIAGADLSEDDRLLVALKEEEGLPWKDIAARFGEHHGKTFQVAALQMRYKRLREKFRVWQGEDIEALKLAHEYWEKYKWDIISSKMLDYGIQERWPSKHCARKWAKISPQPQIPDGMTSGPMPPHPFHLQHPDNNQPHFTFMPIQ